MITIFLAVMLMQEFSTPEGKPLYTWGECQRYVQEAGKQEENPWQVPEVYMSKGNLKPVLRFWRIKMRGMDKGKGDWHLYNKEDDNWLTQVSKQALVEWTLVEGRLPI